MHVFLLRRVGSLLVALFVASIAIFLLVRGVNRLRRQQEAPKPEPTTKKCPYCDSTISLHAIRCPQCTSDLQGGKRIPESSPTDEH